MDILKIGDVVTYIKECKDHDYNEEGLEIGIEYTIDDITAYNYEGYEVDPIIESALVDSVNYHLLEVDWWVQEDCVELLNPSTERKLNAVCRKIKQIEAKRKALGYRW